MSLLSTRQVTSQRAAAYLSELEGEEDGDGDTALLGFESGEAEEIDEYLSSLVKKRAGAGLLQDTRRARDAAAPAPAPGWWAPPEEVEEDDRRYRRFVNTLLQVPLGCENNDSFRINASTVDVQHAKLFALANQVRKLLRRKTQKEGFEDGLELSGDELKPLKTLLVWLRQYTVVHFDAEEKTMQEANYLNMETHKALHRAFYGHVMMFGEIVDEMMQHGGSFHVGNIYVMVAKWLQDHVCVEDKLVGETIEHSDLKDAINGHDTPDGVDDKMPDCVPSLYGKKGCVAPALIMTGMSEPEGPAPERWAAPEALAAHDFWYRTFVTSLLQAHIACELDDNYTVAVRAVDAQHHKLFDLVNTFRKLLLGRVRRLGLDKGLKLTGEELKPLSTTLLWLKQYGVVHLDEEEKVMEEVDYPGLEHHKALHRAFYGQMMMNSEVVDNILKLGGGFHVGPIFVFIAKWAQDHVCVLDKRIEKHIGSHRGELDKMEDIIPDAVDSLPAML